MFAPGDVICYYQSHVEQSFICSSLNIFVKLNSFEMYNSVICEKLVLKPNVIYAKSGLKAS